MCANPKHEPELLAKLSGIGLQTMVVQLIMGWRYVLLSPFLNVGDRVDLYRFGQNVQYLEAAEIRILLSHLSIFYRHRGTFSFYPIARSPQVSSPQNLQVQLFSNFYGRGSAYLHFCAASFHI